jgi:hypothetical protein
MFFADFVSFIKHQGVQEYVAVTETLPKSHLLRNWVLSPHYVPFT